MISDYPEIKMNYGDMEFSLLEKIAQTGKPKVLLFLSRLKKFLKEAQAKRTQITKECSNLTKTI